MLSEPQFWRLLPERTTIMVKLRNNYSGVWGNSGFCSNPQLIRSFSGMSLVSLERFFKHGIYVNNFVKSPICTCGEFDRGKMTKYIAMAERVGMQWSAQEKEQMLNATTYFVPKRQNDGTMLNGYGQLRVEFVEAHVEAVSQNLQLIKLLPPEPSTAQFLKYVADEMNGLTRQFKR